MEETKMKTNVVIANNANKLYEDVTNGLEKFKVEYKGLVDAMKVDPLDVAFEKAGTLLNCIATLFTGAEAGGTKFPGFLVRKSTRDEDTLKELNITVASKLKAVRKFKHEGTVAIDDDFIVNAGKVFVDAMFAAYYVEEASENIEELNERLEELYSKYELTKKVLFDIDTTKSGRVLSITDDVVVINADVDKALDISNIGIMVEGNEYNTLINEEAVKNFVDVMQTVQITPEILKKRIAVVDALVDLRTKKHANKIIRENFHKKAIYLKGGTDDIGYINEKVEGTNVFALVTKTAEGEYVTVLSPFATEALVPFECNVADLVK